MVDSEPGIFNIYSPETSQDIKAKPDLKVDDTNKEDSNFDGNEDSLSGDLRGGLGQLVDGVYGWDNFKAARINGHVKGRNILSKRLIKTD